MRKKLQLTICLFIAIHQLCPAQNLSAQLLKTVLSKDTLPDSAFKNAADSLLTYKEWQFGLLIGPDLVRVSTLRTDAEGKTFTDINTTFGFHLGVSARYNLNKHLFIFPQVCFAFQGIGIDRDWNSRLLEAKTQVAPLTVEIPCHLVYKLYNRCITPAFHAGFRYIQDISPRGIEPVGVRKSNLSFECGAGFDMHLMWGITMMPQLGFSAGLNNLFGKAQSANSVIENTQRQTFELKFLFF